MNYVLIIMIIIIVIIMTIFNIAIIMREDIDGICCTHDGYTLYSHRNIYIFPQEYIILIRLLLRIRYYTNSRGKARERL